jgi:hypothetical protein
VKLRADLRFAGACFAVGPSFVPAFEPAAGCLFALALPAPRFASSQPARPRCASMSL